MVTNDIILMSSILSGVTYANINLGSSLQEAKENYAIANPNSNIENWGVDRFSLEHMNNIKIVGVHQSNGSMTAYIFADFTEKEIWVGFRGTQQFLDYVTDFTLLADIARLQEEAVPAVVEEVEAILQVLSAADPEWSSVVHITGHSLGGHLARYFSQLAEGEGLDTETIVFNAARLDLTIPDQR